MTAEKVTFIGSDDNDALYIDGKLVMVDSTLSAPEMLRILCDSAGIEFAYHFVEVNEVYDAFPNLYPQDLEDLKPYFRD